MRKNFLDGGKLFYGFEVMGYPSIMAMMTFLFGCLFILLGIIGEYLGKVYTQSLNRPTYIIKQKIESSIGEHKAL